MKLPSNKRVAKAVLRRMPPKVRKQATATVRARRTDADVALILSSGAFDLEWYEAQCGRRFESAAIACADYLTAGRRQGRSPHPLFEPSVADPRTWHSTGTDPLVANLRGRFISPSYAHPALPPNWARPEQGEELPRWLAFAASADTDTPMPIAEGAVRTPMTWGEFRSNAIRAAAAIRHTRRIVTDPRRLTPRRPEPATSVTAPPDAAGDEPLVSIVMPTWNRGGVIGAAVASAQAQSLQSWELIVVDDGSDDDTLAVLEGFTSRDDRIRVVTADHRGVCHARNVGIAQARGRYVAFLDSDNSWEPCFLRDVVGHLAAHGVQWGHAAMAVERGGATLYRALDGDHEQLLLGNYIDLNVVVAERDLVRRVGGFDESLRRAVDYDLVLKLAAVAPPTLVPVVGAVYQDHASDLTRISNSESVLWNASVCMRHVVDLDAVRERATVPGRVSVIVPVRDLAVETFRLLDMLLADDGDVEVLVVAMGADRFGRIAEVAAAARPGLTIVQWPVDLHHAAAVVLGASRATGEYLAICAAHCRPEAGWREALVGALGDGVGIAQPLVLHNDGRIASAGAVFVGADPYPSPLLAGMPIEDGAGLDTTTLPAALGSLTLTRARTFWAVGGFDPLLGNSFAEVDFSLRVADAGEGSSVVVGGTHANVGAAWRFGFAEDRPDSARAMRTRHVAPAGSRELWRQVGFDVVGRVVDALMLRDEATSELGVVPVVRPRLESVVEGVPRLRWAIDTAAPAGPKGLMWGDTHFGQSLAASLRAIGQQVHVDRREARDARHRDLDDVTLVLRGLDDVTPRPGNISLMWVISHPDLVSARECARYDQVFAASSSWAAEATERWRVPVRTLLQCTDAALFRPDAAEPDSGDDIVFVGNSRKILRASVKFAIDSGLAPVVYGNGWDGLIPEQLLRATYIPNAELAAVYASAGVVLNDHWDDMSRTGFISNRVFDVLAAGGRLFSDRVAGLADVLGDCVVVYDSKQDFARTFAGDWRARFPDREARLKTAALVRSEHSFDARARELLDAALALHSAAGRASA